MVMGMAYWMMSRLGGLKQEGLEVMGEALGGSHEHLAARSRSPTSLTTVRLTAWPPLSRTVTCNSSYTTEPSLRTTRVREKSSRRSPCCSALKSSASHSRSSGWVSPR